MLRSDFCKQGERVPELSGGWPFIGHLPEFQKDPLALLGRGRREHGNIFRFRLGPQDFVLFIGPDAHDFYFGAAEEQLDAKAVYEFTVPIFGRGVAYDVAPEIMSEQLGFLFPALQSAAMRRFARIMFEEVSLFADALDDEGYVDLPVAMNQLTVNIASHCLIGREVRELVDEGFADAYNDLQKGINTLGFFFPRLPTTAHRARDRARRRVAKLFGGALADRRRHGNAPNDFMQALMTARYKDGRSLDDEEITGLLLTALFAGQHTSSVLATWTGLELMAAPRYLARVREEIREIYRQEGVLSLENLKCQVMLENAVRECERLHPPLIFLVRKVMADLRYRDYLVPRGTLAMVSPAASHRLPNVFRNPERFAPDRFGSPDFEDKQHRYALIGFGGGKHQCIGKRFAYVQLKAIWTVLLDSFDFFLDTVMPAPNYGSWMTGPKEPCRLRYRRRREASVFR